MTGGSTAGDLQLTQLCPFGTITPISYLSATNTVTFQFISDSVVTGKGFLAAVEASKKVQLRSDYFQ